MQGPSIPQGERRPAVRPGARENANGCRLIARPQLCSFVFAAVRKVAAAATASKGAPGSAEELATALQRELDAQLAKATDVDRVWRAAGLSADKRPVMNVQGGRTAAMLALAEELVSKFMQ